MTSYAAASERGRAAALETNTTRRMVTVDHYEWGEHPRGGGLIKVIATCGHSLFTALGATAGQVPFAVEFKYPIGKRKRCPKCPPPVKKPPPPDGERCTYDVTDTRRCKNQAHWQVTHEDGRRPAVWDLLCRRHLKYLVAEGYIVPVEDGGSDHVTPFTRPDRHRELHGREP